MPSFIVADTLRSGSLFERELFVETNSWNVAGLPTMLQLPTSLGGLCCLNSSGVRNNPTAEHLSPVFDFTLNSVFTILFSLCQSPLSNFRTAPIHFIFRH